MGSGILLSMVVQQLVAILVLSQEKVSPRVYTSELKAPITSLKLLLYILYLAFEAALILQMLKMQGI